MTTEQLPSYSDFLQEEIDYSLFIQEHVNERAIAKDLKRINDIVAKAKGSEAKEKQLAHTMVKIIKNKAKATQRFEAALEILGKDHPVTQIFADGAEALGANIDMNATPKKKNTIGKLGSEFDKKKPTSKSYRPSPILPLGKTNLDTGGCKYFNIFETWGESNGSTIEVWKIGGPRGDKLAFIFTSGAGPIGSIGENSGFIHDQTHRYLFDATMVDWANIGDASLIVKKYGKSALGYTYK